MRAFDVSVSHHPERVVLTLAGELDMDTSPFVTEATDRLKLRDQTLTLDMADVSFMDSSSLSMLLLLRARVEAEGGLLELCGLQEQALRVLEITGSHALFLMRPQRSDRPTAGSADRPASEEQPHVDGVRNGPRSADAEAECGEAELWAGKIEHALAAHPQGLSLYALAMETGLTQDQIERSAPRTRSMSHDGDAPGASRSAPPPVPGKPRNA